MDLASRTTHASTTSLFATGSLFLFLHPSTQVHVLLENILILREASEERLSLPAGGGQGSPRLALPLPGGGSQSSSPRCGNPGPIPKAARRKGSLVPSFHDVITPFVYRGVRGAIWTQQLLVYVSLLPHLPRRAGPAHTSGAAAE